MVERNDASVNVVDFKMGSNTVPENGGRLSIYWSPDIGSLNDTGIVSSPASDLSHEADHANDYLTNRISHDARQRAKDKAYDNKEERRVITVSEQRTAIANGEIKKGQFTRKNHKGDKVIIIGGPTSTKIKKVLKH